MNRKQFVSYNKEVSKSVPVNSGIAQGGVLSPTQYNLYVSDAPAHIVSPNFMFADDTLFVKAIKTEQDISILQKDIENFENYCTEKELILNESKCKHLRVSLKRYVDHKYVIKQKLMERVETHKHLGITYDQKMSFNSHCEEVVSKALHKFNYLKIICKRVSGLTFLRLYKTYVLPIIEFSNNCFVPNITQLKTFEKIQRRVILNIFVSKCVK